MGLTISKRLAELLGGDVRIVQSQLGVGTTFRLTIAAGPLEGIRLLQPTDSFAAQEEPLRDQAVVAQLCPKDAGFCWPRTVPTISG